MPYPFEEYKDPKAVTQEMIWEADANDPANEMMDNIAPEPSPDQQSSGNSAKAGGSTQPKQQQSQPTKTEPEKPKEEFNLLQTGIESTFAIPAGIVDFGIDLVNKIPGVEVPKIPAFKNDVFQSIREVSSFVVPTILLSKAGVKAGTAAQARVGAQIGNNRAFQWLSKAGLSSGAGVAVDAVNTLNEKDDNALGALKKRWPQAFGWVSNDYATVDGDSPDVIRRKNILEGFYLGAILDVAEGAAKLINAGTSFSKWVARDAKGKAYIAQQKALENIDPITRGDIKHQVSLDEIGDLKLATDPEALSKPTLGIHDAFEEVEQGVRTVDPMGPMGALGDAARIADNNGTRQGRLRNFISEPVLKYGLNADSIKKRELVKSVEEQIKNSGKFDYLAGSKLYTNNELLEQGLKLAKDWYNERYTLDEFKNLLDSYKVAGKEGVSVLSSEAQVGATILMRQYLEDFISESSVRAAGLINVQKTGLLSDIAEGARLMEGTPAIERANEQMLDLFEYLLIETGITKYFDGRALQQHTLWKRILDPAAREQAAADAALSVEESLDKVISRGKETANTLRQIAAERPEFLRPLQYAWDFTDGKVNSMKTLNEFIQESLPNVYKAFVDGNPQVPNVIVNGLWSNIYNSALSSLATSSKAFFGNAAMLLIKPMTTMGGALARRDLQTFQRAWFGYSALGDTMRNSFSHFNTVFRKAAEDPNSVSYIVRDDLALRNDQQWQILDAYAKAAKQRGEYGPMVLYDFAKAIDDLSNHPLLRFGPNFLSATDGFTRAFISHVEARTRVFDKYIAGGERLTGKTYREAADEVYKQMFDKSGMITDAGVDYASREIALNLDTPASDALSKIISRLPILRTVMMFPRTGMNIIYQVDSFSRIGFLAKEYHELTRKNVDEFTREEIEEVLKKRGIPFDDTAIHRFNTLVAEARGRRAFGDIVMASAGFMFMNDSLTGDGFFNKERQKVRQSVGWRRRMYKGFDGKWYSYDNLGPVSDIIAAVATTLDHFDTLDEPTLQTHMHKIGFLLGTFITNKSMLSGAEAIFDIMRGEPAAATKWASQLTSNLLPLGGLRNEMGRYLSEGLKELDLDYFQMMRNRNNYLDVVDPAGRLPDMYSWLDGTKINDGENFFARMFNSLLPLKVSGKEITPEAEFLMDIEFDARPTLIKSSRGVEYTPKERSELAKLIGQDKYFLNGLRKIMASADAKEFRDSLKAARSSGPVNPEKWQNLHNRINLELRRAQRIAESKLSTRDEIKLKEYQNRLGDIRNTKGETLPYILINK